VPIVLSETDADLLFLPWLASVLLHSTGSKSPVIQERRMGQLGFFDADKRLETDML
jgi:hypothetical protein